MNSSELIATCWTTAGNAAPLKDDEVSPLDIRDRIDAAAAAGWEGFGIVHADLAATRSEPGWPAIRSMLDDHGFAHVELEFLNEWWTDDHRRASSDTVRADLFAAAEVLRPRHIKVGSEFTDAPVDDERFASEFNRLCNQAADVGTRIALEPTPWSNLPTIKAGSDFVSTVANPSGGLCVDIWHVYRGGTDPSELPGILTPGTVFAVELNDADDQIVGTLFEDTINNRRVCGEGAWDVPAFIRAMREVEFNGPWGVEIISHEHRQRKLEDALRLARETTLAAFASA